MTTRTRRIKIFSRCDGVGAVEFAIILPVLMLLVLGGMDLAHSYYIKNIITNASLAGARYGANYTYPNPPPTSDQISTYLKTTLNYNSLNLSSLTVSGSYTGTSPNKIVTVSVQANKYWWILNILLPTGVLPNPLQLTATTAMTCEGG